MIVGIRPHAHYQRDRGHMALMPSIKDEAEKKRQEGEPKSDGRTTSH